MTDPLPGSFGALMADDGVLFRVFAPRAREMRLVLHAGPSSGEYRMRLDGGGIWELTVPGIQPGQRYAYCMDDRPERPDPASRFQPLGVHGPSEVVAPDRFAWTDGSWHGIEAARLVIYELHVGTFSEAGTFRGVIEHLEALRDLGINAIELMPVADFAGNRGWGYDGVALYAPSRAYGHPDDLRALVDRAHALDIAVLLDVVYNHLGPEGAYLPGFNPQFLTAIHQTPWGQAVNLDGAGSDMVRRFIIDNATHWVREYHFDGLRVDATHALIDTRRPHFVRELAAAVRAAAARHVVVHAEDVRNLSEIVRDDGDETWGLDAVWADDFHHVIRRLVAGDSHGYYADYEGTCEELARTIRQGWLYTGEHSGHMQCLRGTDPSDIPMNRFVVCLQNHDQVGNRALGDRLHHRVDAATWRAVSMLLLTAPMTPLIFMGQEWAASTPFQFFSDLGPPFGALVSAGRREEFRGFPEFAGAAAFSIPDPQSPDTFAASRLRWEERGTPGHARVQTLYRDLLALRRTEPVLGASDAATGDAVVLDSDTLAVRRRSADATMWIVVRLRGGGSVDLSHGASTLQERARAWQTVRTTEDPAFVEEPAPIRITMHSAAPVIHFERPGGVIFRIAPFAA
jgi:maltooligosyltrehalose trehalohydrolase